MSPRYVREHCNIYWGGGGGSYMRAEKVNIPHLVFRARYYENIASYKSLPLLPPPKKEKKFFFCE